MSLQTPWRSYGHSVTKGSEESFLKQSSVELAQKGIDTNPLFRGDTYFGTKSAPSTKCLSASLAVGVIVFEVVVARPALLSVVVFSSSSGIVEANSGGESFSLKIHFIPTPFYGKQMFSHFSRNSMQKLVTRYSSCTFPEASQH